MRAPITRTPIFSCILQDSQSGFLKLSFGQQTDCCLRSELTRTRLDKLRRENQHIVLFLRNRIDAHALGFRHKSSEENSPESFHETVFRRCLDGISAVLFGNTDIFCHLLCVHNQPIQIILEFL